MSETLKRLPYWCPVCGTELTAEYHCSKCGGKWNRRAEAARVWDRAIRIAEEMRQDFSDGLVTRTEAVKAICDRLRAAKAEEA